MGTVIRFILLPSVFIRLAFITFVVVRTAVSTAAIRAAVAGVLVGAGISAVALIRIAATLLIGIAIPIVAGVIVNFSLVCGCTPSLPPDPCFLQARMYI